MPSCLASPAKANPETVPVRFVQVGMISEAEIALPDSVLRSSVIRLMGSGIGSVPLEGLIAAFGDVIGVIGLAGLRIATDAGPLIDVKAA